LHDLGDPGHGVSLSSVTLLKDKAEDSLLGIRSADFLYWLAPGSTFSLCPDMFGGDTDPALLVLSSTLTSSLDEESEATEKSIFLGTYEDDPELEPPDLNMATLNWCCLTH
jgi:hypothetical protein